MGLFFIFGKKFMFANMFTVKSHPKVATPHSITKILFEAVICETKLNEVLDFDISKVSYSIVDVMFFSI